MHIHRSPAAAFVGYTRLHTAVPGIIINNTVPHLVAVYYVLLSAIRMMWYRYRYVLLSCSPTVARLPPPMDARATVAARDRRRDRRCDRPIERAAEGESNSRGEQHQYSSTASIIYPGQLTHPPTMMCVCSIAQQYTVQLYSRNKKKQRRGFELTRFWRPVTSHGRGVCVTTAVCGTAVCMCI